MQTIDFKTKVLPMSGRMMRFADQFLKDGDEAKDVVQDIFLKLWQMRDDLSKIDNLDAFAMKMIRNRCLDLIRARRVVSIDEGTERKLNRELVEERDELELTDTAGRIRALIGRLPEQQQAVMYMRDIENQEYDEIAMVTGMNTNAIRVNLSRARKKVREELVKIWENENERSKNIVAKIF
jgi:RNA polymerase sigma-70 factor (ECF subfamily)